MTSCQGIWRLLKRVVPGETNGRGGSLIQARRGVATATGYARLSPGASGARRNKEELDMAVRLAITINAAPGKGAEFAQAFRPRCEQSLKDRGCQQFELY